MTSDGKRLGHMTLSISGGETLTSRSFPNIFPYDAEWTRSEPTTIRTCIGESYTVVEGSMLGDMFTAAERVSVDSGVPAVFVRTEDIDQVTVVARNPR